MDRNETIKTIKANLKARSGKTWSVKGGRGTVHGWITIESPPSRIDEYGNLPESDRQELAKLLGLESVHQQGVSIPAGNDYYAEYVSRSAGKKPVVIGRPYWD